MTRIVTSLLASTAFIGLVTAAQAADLGSPLRGPAVVEPIAESSSATGWYLRGDVGYSFRSTAGFDADLPYANFGSTTVTRDRLGDAAMFGVGVGYQFTDMLRGDITADFYTRREVSGAVNFIGGSSSGYSWNQNTFDGHLTAQVFLANAYVDMGKFYGLTPYVGAGIGAAHLSMSALDEYADSTALSGSAISGSTTGSVAGRSKWNFAWALHAGMSYDIMPNLKLDLGYSFKDLGSAGGLGPESCANSCTSNAHYDLKQVVFHDVHIGARWMFDAPLPKAPVYSAPIVAKY